MLTLNMLDALPARTSGGVGELAVAAWPPVVVRACPLPLRLSGVIMRPRDRWLAVRR